MKNSAKENLMSLEILRDFVKKVVPSEIYLKNLIIDGIETPNKRLWALREFLKYDEEEFARKLNIDCKHYHLFEKIGNPIPLKFLEKVSETFNISVDWLTCKRPLFPIENYDL